MTSENDSLDKRFISIEYIGAGSPFIEIKKERLCNP